MNDKEFGSDFHYLSDKEYREVVASFTFFDDQEQFYFSGRAALRAILSDGIHKYSWEKIYVPTYYCHEVYDFIKDLNIAIEFYECNPLANEIPASIQDKESYVLLVVNYFGLSSAYFEYLRNIVVIEDLTHDLESINRSNADYVFASLRKILPVPVGGLVRSAERLPEIPVTLFSEEIVQEKISGMLLKKKYLEGSFTGKEIFRNLLTSAEQSFENHKTFTSLPFLATKYLLGLNVHKIMEAKKSNSAFAKESIKENAKFELLTSTSNSEYALILKFDVVEERNKLKKHLISRNIYPMVLWPNQSTKSDAELENLLLFVHIDFRYSSEDITYIVDIINRFSSNA